MKLLSWNVNGRVGTVARQASEILGRHPDVVALQEVTAASRPFLRQAFEKGGLTSIVDSFALLESTSHLIGPRRYGLLMAARFPLTSLTNLHFSVPWPERVLGVKGQGVSIYTTYIPPGSSNGWKKIETLEGLYAGLAKAATGPRILCGDFNTPQSEQPTGNTITWGQRVRDDGRVTLRNRMRGGTGQRWDAGERNILCGLSDFDLTDVFRMLHGFQREEFSWYTKRKGVLRGRRFDHVFASASLHPTACIYLHAFREAGLSNHSPIEVVFSWRV
jgi:exonuclease III